MRILTLGALLQADGLMGLSNDRNVLNIFELAVADKKLVSDIFAFELRNTAQKKPSHFYYNVSYSDFPLAHYIKCSRRNYWTIPINTFKINTIEYKVKQALIDTGASFIIFPNEIFATIYNTYFSNCPRGFFSGIFECKCQRSYPDLEFESTGAKIILTPEMYFQRESDTRCLLLMSGSDMPFIIFGDAFMRNYLVIFDKASNKIGLQGNFFRYTEIPGSNAPSYNVNNWILSALSTLIAFAIMYTVRLIRKELAQERKSTLESVLLNRAIYSGDAEKPNLKSLNLSF